MEKPKFLYHASPNKDITVFEPRRETARDLKEGPVVFATPSKAYASMFMVSSDDTWTSKGQFNGTWYQAIANKDRFIQIDKGGAIYTLPSEKFETNATKGLGLNEWTSKETVSPNSKELYDSCLSAMLQNGVRVFFITEDNLREFRQNLRTDKIKEAFDLLFSQPEYTKQ
jgi:hypothetical protein